jgi:hypothetical protein
MRTTAIGHLDPCARANESSRFEDLLQVLHVGGIARTNLVTVEIQNAIGLCPIVVRCAPPWLTTASCLCEFGLVEREWLCVPTTQWGRGAWIGN